MDMVLIQEHKLRGRNLDTLGNRIMLNCTICFLEGALGKKNWINPHGAGKGGDDILLANKHVRLVTTHGAPYHDRVI